MSARVGRRLLRRDRRGAAAVEFAIAFPLLAVLAFGAIDFGRAFFLRNSLITAAREGARAGAVLQTLCTGQGAAATTMRNAARAAFSDPGSLTDAYMTVSISPSGVNACIIGPTDVRLNVVGFPFTPITPVMRLIGRNGGFAVNASASYRWDLGEN
jgi:Flp pilus assembly protein TadG